MNITSAIVSDGIIPTIMIITFNLLFDPFGTGQVVIGLVFSYMIVEQDISKALEVSGRFYCLQEGRVSLEGTPGNISRDDISRAYFGL